MPHIAYLHGFRSSPQSFKARRLAQWLAEHRPDVPWWCPQLPASPRQAWDLITEHLARWPSEDTVVIGSSLGGFYATAAAERTGCRALLLNPAVDPARDLMAHIGTLTQFHDPDQPFVFKPEYVDELRALTVGAITRPGRYAALIAKGDEQLDWREMVGRYPGATVRLLDGSDHGLSDFESHLPWVLAQLGLATPMGQSPG